MKEKNKDYDATTNKKVGAILSSVERVCWLFHMKNTNIRRDLQIEPRGTTEHSLGVTSSLVHKLSGAVTWRK